MTLHNPDSMKTGRLKWRLCDGDKTLRYSSVKTRWHKEYQTQCKITWVHYSGSLQLSPLLFINICCRVCGWRMRDDKVRRAAIVKAMDAYLPFCCRTCHDCATNTSSVEEVPFTKAQFQGLAAMALWVLVWVPVCSCYTAFWSSSSY
jgi:hypothetical protein